MRVAWIQGVRKRAHTRRRHQRRMFRGRSITMKSRAYHTDVALLGWLVLAVVLACVGIQLAF